MVVMSMQEAVQPTMQQTEFPFVLPQGYVDSEGTLHREGIMRLSTAYDEIAPMRDPRVQSNPGYLVIILLSRVITQLGTVHPITPKLIEGLFSGDLIFLQDFYQRINQNGHSRLQVTCPHCQGEFQVETVPLGES
nr:phage tail assembly protein [Nodosilinea sp. FACHB-141]